MSAPGRPKGEDREAQPEGAPANGAGWARRTQDGTPPEPGPASAAPADPPDSGVAVYVYYKVSEPALAAVVADARALQACLRGRLPGLRCSLLRRPGLREGLVTLMETYAGPLPPDFEERLAAAAVAWPGLPAARFVERFEALSAG